MQSYVSLRHLSHFHPPQLISTERELAGMAPLPILLIFLSRNIQASLLLGFNFLFVLVIHLEDLTVIFAPLPPFLLQGASEKDTVNRC